jgi:hypothetical protein
LGYFLVFATGVGGLAWVSGRDAWRREIRASLVAFPPSFRSLVHDEGRNFLVSLLFVFIRAGICLIKRQANESMASFDVHFKCGRHDPLLDAVFYTIVYE